MSSRQVQSLGSFGRDDVSMAGGKGANLGELIRSGVAVPDGFVVTTAAYAENLAALALRSDPPRDTPGRAATRGPAAAMDAKTKRQALATSAVPSTLAAEITRAYADLGGGPVAVRSSATAEDLPGAAFAGQQETFLNVTGADQVLEAVRDCWASLWSDRAVTYRTHVAVSEEPQIAVVVQRMVPAEFAGVLFTANPVTGARDEVVIELNPGLGEAVVAGLVTPERVRLDHQGHISERQAGRTEVVIEANPAGGVTRRAPDLPTEGLPAAVLTELAVEGVKIARHFGGPQDIEWAYAEGRTWIVQARPMTALPPAPIRANRFQRAVAVMCVDLLPSRPFPLDLTTWTVPGWFAILARMAAEIPAIRLDIGAMFPTVDGVLTEIRPPDPRPTWRTWLTPVRMLDRLRRYDPAFWTHDPRFARYQDQVDQLQNRDLTTLTWTELTHLPEEVLARLNDAVDLRIDYLPAALLAVARLRALLAVLGLTAWFWPLLAGQPTQTRAGNEALQQLGLEVRHRPDWTEAFQALDDAALIEAIDTEESFAPLREAVRRWIEAFGHRETTSAALVSAPTWADDPSLLLGSLRGQLRTPEDHPAPSDGIDPEPAVVPAAAVAALRRVRWLGLGPRIERAAAAARAGSAFREDSHYYALRVRPILRGALLEAGSRLARTGVLEHRDEVFHLELDELRAISRPDGVDAGQRDQLRDRVQRRAQRRAELGRAPLISPATVYPGRRRRPPDVLVSGTPGGGGSGTGPVRIIRDPTEFARLGAGEVLVCPYTNPAWTPLFARAAAVVADSGSFASHAAIVAREYGVPAVLGTGDGTHRLAEGMVVTVDGDRGFVTPAPPEVDRG